MNKNTVIDYFGSKNQTAKKLGVSRQYVGQWRDRIPVGMAYRVEVVSNGDLKVNMDDYPNDRGRRYGKSHDK